MSEELKTTAVGVDLTSKDAKPQGIFGLMDVDEVPGTKEEKLARKEKKKTKKELKKEAREKKKAARPLAAGLGF